MVNLEACFQWLEINTSRLKNKVNSVFRKTVYIQCRELTVKHQTPMCISMEQFTSELLLIYKRERAPITISVQEKYAYLLESDIIRKKNAMVQHTLICL